MFRDKINHSKSMHNTNPYIDKRSKWSSHSLIASMLEGLPEGTRILDIGSSTGMLARFCEGRGYYFRGIEPNPHFLEKARNLYQDIYNGNLEETPEVYLGENEVVVLGDVLEHLVHPEEQLNRLVNAQKSDCIFIISVPNIANLWIRLNLLIGRFEYEGRGILDRTHLHFYTRKSFMTLLLKAGLKIDEFRTTPIPLELVNVFFIEKFLGKVLYAILTRLTKWWPTMFGYQLVVKACKLK